MLVVGIELIHDSIFALSRSSTNGAFDCFDSLETLSLKTGYWNEVYSSGFEIVVGFSYWFLVS